MSVFERVSPAIVAQHLAGNFDAGHLISWVAAVWRNSRACYFLLIPRRLAALRKITCNVRAEMRFLRLDISNGPFLWRRGCK